MKANLYEVGLSMVTGIGNVLTRQLISYCGSAENIFKSSKGKLLKIPGIGEKTASEIIKAGVLKKAEEEIKKAEKSNVELVFYLHPDYPKRFKSLLDAPALLYQRGQADLNAERTLAIVGTRKATEYGKAMTDDIVAGLKHFQVTIISGLAYGIDIQAHRAALKNNLPTIAVLANGLDSVYPSAHAQTAKQIIENQGALLSEQILATKPDAHLFPARNRIVAGLADAVLVIEAAATGGALITADIANNYNREVFAVTGRLDDECSAGCLNLIRDHKANIFTKVEDLFEMLNWNLNNEQNVEQTFEMPLDLENDEKTLLELLSKEKEMMIDDIAWQTQLGVSKTASALFTLEMKGLVKALTGKRFARI